MPHSHIMVSHRYPVIGSSNVYYDFNRKQEINHLPTEAFICLCQTVLQKAYVAAILAIPKDFHQPRTSMTAKAFITPGYYYLKVNNDSSNSPILIVLLLYLCNHLTKVSVGSNFF